MQYIEAHNLYDEDGLASAANDEKGKGKAAGESKGVAASSSRE